MGSFISMSGIIGKDQREIIDVLNYYFEQQQKKLKETALTEKIFELFILHGEKNNSVVLYPQNYFEFNEVAMHLSKELKVPIFNFYIHDIDLWEYEMYYNGRIVDKFSPIFDRNLNNVNEKEYKGSPKVVCKYLKDIELTNIKKYYKVWTDELIKSKKKAYPSDEFSYGVNWQAIDFMKKLNLKYPITDEEETIGRAFKLI